MTIMSRLLGGSAATPMADAQPVKAPGGVGASAYATGYMRGGRSVALRGWQPSLREDHDNIVAAWDKAAARATDAIINSGWLSGAVEQCIANTVGTGLRLKAQPENEAFGMSNADAQAWARKVEQRFELWAGRPEECDVQGMRTLGQMQDAAFRGYLATGEVLAETVWRKRPWNNFGTKIRVLPAYRLDRASDAMRQIKAGVVVDSDDMPIGYVARQKSAILGSWTTRIIPARDRFGRKLVGHFFDAPLGSFRGIGPLVPVLQVVRQFDDLSDATLAGQIMRTIWAAVIESEMPTEQAFQGLMTLQEQSQIAASGESQFGVYMDMMAGFYEAAPVDVGQNGRVAHLMPGDKLNLQHAGSPGSDYLEFSNDLKREIARALGMTYESFTGDYQGASYNSMAYGTTEIFEITRRRRANLIAPFCQMAYEAWLEEEIEAGNIEFPGGIDNFVANRAAASRAIWRGSPKPLADMLKTSKAAEIMDRIGTLSQGMIADWFGADIEDVYAARQQEAEMRRSYDLPEPAYMNAAGGGPGQSKDGDEGTDE